MTKVLRSIVTASGVVPAPITTGDQQNVRIALSVPSWRNTRLRTDSVFPGSRGCFDGAGGARNVRTIFVTMRQLAKSDQSRWLFPPHQDSEDRPAGRAMLMGRRFFFLAPTTFYDTAAVAGGCLSISVGAVLLSQPSGVGGWKHRNQAEFGTRVSGSRWQSSRRDTYRQAIHAVRESTAAKPNFRTES